MKNNLAICTSPDAYVTVANGTYFIEGQFNLIRYGVAFNSCTLKMGNGAVIYLGKGFINPATFVAIDTRIEGTTCGMWRGIIAPEDGRIYLDGCYVGDAEMAIEAGSCLTAIECNNVEFNNNFVSIYYPRNLGGSSSFTELNGLPTVFQQCTFHTTSPMTLPTFNGQHGIPINQRPFAGMLLNDLFSATPGNPSIPFSQNASCTFENMFYGVYSVNSDIDVFNCRFINIEFPPSGSQYDLSSAVYLDNACSYCSSIKKLNVGGILPNTFDNCWEGVSAIGEVDADITSNTFLTSQLFVNNRSKDISLVRSYNGRTINVSQNYFSDYRIGLLMDDLSHANIVVQDNNFYGTHSFTNTSSFTSTAIYIAAPTGTYMQANINKNYFTDSRIGIYLNGVQGVTPNLFDIHENYMFNDLPFSDLQTLFNAGYNCYGIWCDGTRNMNIRYNHFSRQFSVSNPPPTNFDLMLRALNVKQSRFLEIYENDIFHFGTPMRFVSNCNSTNLHCNYMYGCYKGIYLDYASMTAQGNPGDPWDNKWWGFTSARVLGATVVPLGVPWYHRGITCPTAACNNEFSPGPYASGVIFPFPNQISTNSCVHGNGGGGNQSLLNDITNNSISYSYFQDESRYYDKEYAYEYLKENIAVLNSNPDYETFYMYEQQGNIGKFDEAKEDVSNGDLIAALSKLNVIVDQNNIEYNKKYLMSLELEKKISGNHTYTTQEKNEIENIAHQTAWEGGSAVFDARRRLMLEVDDQVNNLKIKRNIASVADLKFNIYPNPGYGIINIHSEYFTNGELNVFDTSGRLMLNTSFFNGHAQVYGLEAGMYSLILKNEGKVIHIQKLIVIK